MMFMQYKFYTDKKGNRYFYTSKKYDHKGKMRYLAGDIPILQGYQDLQDGQEGWVCKEEVGN